MVPARLKEVEKANEIGLGIIVGVNQRMAYTGLGREMNNPLELPLGKKRLDAPLIGKIAFYEAEAAAAV
jgi:hypothetical protein